MTLLDAAPCVRLRLQELPRVTATGVTNGGTTLRRWWRIIGQLYPRRRCSPVIPVTLCHWVWFLRAVVPAGAWAKPRERSYELPVGVRTTLHRGEAVLANYTTFGHKSSVSRSHLSPSRGPLFHLPAAASIRSVRAARRAQSDRFERLEAVVVGQIHAIADASRHSSGIFLITL